MNGNKNNKISLIDAFGRVHNYLRISLSERCNLRCFYCMPAEGIPLSPKSHIMTFEEIIAISQVFIDMGVNQIRLTGGEPLIRKDFDKLLVRLSSLSVQLKITTNAVILDKYFDVLKQCGVKTLNISLDTLNAKKYKKITLRNDFSRVYDNILKACALDFEVKINIVLMKGTNEDEIINFVALTKDLPLTVKFIEFMPFKDNSWHWEKGVAYADLLKEIKGEFPNIINIPVGKNSTSIEWQVPEFKGKIGMINSVTKPFCAGCNRLRLTADGKMKNCLFSNNELDLLTPFRKGEALENIIMESLLEKKKIRAGMETFEDFSRPSNNEDNRSMTTIGG